MERELLKINNLTVALGKKVILRDVNLAIKSGEIHALLGPNGSGKTTLSQVMMGLSPYKVIKGSIIFQDKNITKLAPEKRARLGMGLVFQNPPAIKGVTLNSLIQEITSNTKAQPDFFSEKIIANLKTREINLGFSGGEKKVSELYQLVCLNSQLVILDEIDSGLDIDRLKEIISFLKNKFSNHHRSFLIITHREDILKYLNPSMTHILLEGKIICSSKNWLTIWKTIKKYGYEKCQTCSKKIC